MYKDMIIADCQGLADLGIITQATVDKVKAYVATPAGEAAVRELEQAGCRTSDASDLIRIQSQYVK